MGCWIPGPENMSWPANVNRKPQPESPHQAAIAEPASEAKPRRRRSTKPAE